VPVALALAVAGLLGAFAPGAPAATKAVTAGPPVQDPPAGVPADAVTNQFFPKEVTVHRGDTVAWRFAGLHSVTFPELGQAPPSLVGPDPATPVGSLLDATGAPWWFDGGPRLVLDPDGAQPRGGAALTGRRLSGSGLALDGRAPKPYRLTFRRTGTFRYYCVLHPGQRGTVRVLSRTRGIPSAAADRRSARRQFDAVVDRLEADADFAGPPGKLVDAGHDTVATGLLRFFPQSRTVKVGDAVTFRMSTRTSEAHTVTFGPPDLLPTVAQGLITPDPAGGSPPAFVVDPVGGYASDPPPVLPPYTGANHGNGYLNTGMLDRDRTSPAPGLSRVTFTSPGTFTYRCLIHPDMAGQIVVTP
jgi:plastocyanin